MKIYLVRYSQTKDNWDHAMVVGVYRNKTLAIAHATAGGLYYKIFEADTNNPTSQMVEIS